MKTKSILQVVLTTSFLVFFVTTFSQCCGGSKKSCSKNSSESTKSIETSTTSEVIYVCPMHADVTSKAPGKCTKCGMDLEQMKKEVSSNSNTKTEAFSVNGNCGMCKTRIENAAKSVKGVTSVEWDVESKMLTLTFDESKTKIEAIHKAIAKVGHDTNLEKADASVYSNLPGCCKYERK